MTPLRKHLQTAKAEYAAGRYPGDLARDVPGDVLGDAPVRMSRHFSHYLWPRRALAIAAALALATTTFFVGQYEARYQARRSFVAIKTDAPELSSNSSSATVPATAPSALPSATTASDTATASVEEFTLVPAIAAIADDGNNKVASTADAVITGSASMDFSLSVPSLPMLFSIDSLAEQEMTATQAPLSSTSSEKQS